MNQGIYNQSTNYGQFYIPNAQPMLIFQQPNQIVNKLAYNEFPNYIPLTQPCIISPMPSIYYIPQQIVYQSQEEQQQKAIKSPLQINETKSVTQPFLSEKDENAKSLNKLQEFECQENSKNDTQQDIQQHIFKKNSSQSYLNRSQQEQLSENKFFQGINNHKLNCTQDNVDYSDDSKDSKLKKKCTKSQQITEGDVNLPNKCFEHQQSIKKRLYQKSKFINQKNQAGFRIKNFNQRLNYNNNIQLICTLGRILQCKNEQNEFHSGSALNENTYSSADSPFNQLKQGENKALNFKQVSSYEKKKKQLKNLEKDYQKIQKSLLVKNEFNLNAEGSKQINLQIGIREKSSSLPEEIRNFPKQFERKCIYQQLCSLRKEIKADHINENELSCILIKKLSELNLFKQISVCSSDKEEEKQGFQKQGSNLNEQSQLKSIKLEYNAGKEIENENYTLTNVIMKSKINYSDFVNMLSEKVDSLEEIQIKQLQRLQNQQINLNSVQGNKESLVQYSKNQEKGILLNDKNCNKYCDQELKSRKVLKLFENCDQVLQSISLAEILMEDTKTHQTIFSMINQNRETNSEEQFQDFLNLQNQPSYGEIHMKFPQINYIENTDQNLNKFQPFQSVVLQANNSTTTSATSQEKIPCLQEAQLLQNQISSYEQQFLQFQVKNYELLEKFDFSQIRQITQKYRSSRQQKQNTTYKANSKYHNMNKLLMYNIMGMFQIDNLQNFTLDEKILAHLAQIVKTLKILSKRSSEKYKFEYFSREHYHILFLKITDSNLEFLANSEKDRFLHQKCFNVDFQKQLNPVHLNYINIMKKLFFQIFITSIQYEKIIDDGSASKQNLRRQYCLKAISGIKKLSNGEILVRF
ncbi:hypothetical protein ABPG72_008755 [Tetrahymena utriculariae]